MDLAGCVYILMHICVTIIIKEEDGTREMAQEKLEKGKGMGGEIVELHCNNNKEYDSCSLCHISTVSTLRKWKQGGPEAQGHPQLLKEFKATLAYVGDYFSRINK